MTKLIKLTGLEEGGALSANFLKDYEKLTTRAQRRNLLHSVVRSGYAAELMGLTPMIAILEESLGPKFLKMPKRERLQRLLALISAVMGDELDLPAQSAPPAAGQSGAVPPAAAATQPAENAQPVQDENQQEVANERAVVTRNEDDNSTLLVEDAPAKAVTAGALKLQRHRVSRTPS
ncbi:hypothetical protein [Pantoea agglomerans]|jgi:hypothetical protein|uniref:hypothetical protein n=1 Tax=Enterobacter agglomerans TaxID=549 RepID=UPI003C797659